MMQRQRCLAKAKMLAKAKWCLPLSVTKWGVERVEGKDTEGLESPPHSLSAALRQYHYPLGFPKLVFFLLSVYTSQFASSWNPVFLNSTQVFS